MSRANSALGDGLQSRVGRSRELPPSRASQRFSALFDGALAEVEALSRTGTPATPLPGSSASLFPVLAPRPRSGTPGGTQDFDRQVAAMNGVPFDEQGGRGSRQGVSPAGGRPNGVLTTPAPRMGETPLGGGDQDGGDTASVFTRSAARVPPKPKVSVTPRRAISGASAASGDTLSASGQMDGGSGSHSASQSSGSVAQVSQAAPLAAIATAVADRHDVWSTWMETRVRDGARHSCAPVLSTVPAGSSLANFSATASEMIDAALAHAAQDQRNAVDAVARLVKRAAVGARPADNSVAALSFLPPGTNMMAATAASLRPPSLGAGVWANPFSPRADGGASGVPGMLAGLQQLVAQARSAAAHAMTASMSAVVPSGDKSGVLAEQRAKLADMERQLADAEERLHVLNSKVSGQAPRSGEDMGDGAQQPYEGLSMTPMPPSMASTPAHSGVAPWSEPFVLGGASFPGDMNNDAAVAMWTDDGGAETDGAGEAASAPAREWTMADAAVMDAAHAAVSEANYEAAAAVQAALALHAPTPAPPSTRANSRASTMSTGWHATASARSGRIPLTGEQYRRLGVISSGVVAPLTPEARRARMAQLQTRKQQLQAAAAVAAAKAAVDASTSALVPPMMGLLSASLGDPSAADAVHPDDILRAARAEAAMASRHHGGAAVMQPAFRQAAQTASMEAALASAAAAQGARVRALLSVPMPATPKGAAEGEDAQEQHDRGHEGHAMAPGSANWATGETAAGGAPTPGTPSRRAPSFDANVVLLPRHRSRSPVRGESAESPKAAQLPPVAQPQQQHMQIKRAVYGGAPQARKSVRFVPSSAPLGAAGAAGMHRNEPLSMASQSVFDAAERARMEAEEEAVQLAAQVHADVVAISQLAAHMMASIANVMPAAAGVIQDSGDTVVPVAVQLTSDEERIRLEEQAALDELASTVPDGGSSLPADNADLKSRVSAAMGTMTVLDVRGAQGVTPDGVITACEVNPALTRLHASAIHGDGFSLDQVDVLYTRLWAPQLVEVDLRASVGEVQHLVQALSQHRGLRIGSLTLTGGTLRADAVRALAAAVAATPGGCAALRLPQCFLATDALAELLTQLPPCVTALDLRGNALASGGAALVSGFLARARGAGGALAGGPNLRSLVLDDNAFTDADVALLAHGCAAASGLDSLSLRDCRLGPAAARHLGRCFSDTPGVGLQSLDVSRNPLGDDGISALAACFRVGSAAARGIHTLKVAHTGCTAQGVRSLSACLRGNSTLAVLDVSHNALGDAGARVLATLLGGRGANAARGLVTINMSHCGVGELGALEMGHALTAAGVRCSLRQLVLTGNEGITLDVLAETNLPSTLRVVL